MSKYKMILIEEESCANCYQMQFSIAPICEKRNIEFQVINKDKIDVSFLEKYDVKSLPAGLFFKDDEMIGKFKGYQPDEILEIWIDIKMDERGNN